MTAFSPAKKFILSVTFAFLFLLYAPLACLVGNDASQEQGQAYAETAAEESAEISENETLVYKENVSFNE